MFYAENPDGTVRRVSALEGAQQFAKERRVAFTKVGGLVISTVFLVINHSFSDDQPVLYETVVFATDGHDLVQRRYHTRDEALAGHMEIASKPYLDCLLSGVEE